MRRVMDTVTHVASKVPDRPIAAPGGMPHPTVAHGIADDHAADVAVVNDIPGRAEVVLGQLVRVYEHQDLRAGYYHWNISTAAVITLTR